MSSFSKNILATIVYYDVLDYPLTSYEVWKYLTVAGERSPEEERISLSDVMKELDNGNLSRAVEEYQGYFFLKGRRHLIANRLNRNKISVQKLKAIQRTVFWLRFVPYLRMIAVTGRVAMKNAENKSDLDFLVVFKREKIFTGRFFLTGLIHILGKRRYSDKVSNRICLNHFVTDESLEINLKDLFSASEYSFIFPIFGFSCFHRFQKSNAWIKKYKINFQADQLSNAKIVRDTFLSKQIRKIGECLLSFEFLEKGLGSWQKNRVAKDPRTKMTGSIIIAESDSLVFLPEPQGPEVFEKFRERLGGLRQ